MNNIMDSVFNDCPRIGMYRSGLVPDLYPDEPQPRLENWPLQDLEMFVGGKYTPGYVHESAQR